MFLWLSNLGSAAELDGFRRDIWKFFSHRQERQIIWIEEDFSDFGFRVGRKLVLRFSSVPEHFIRKVTIKLIFANPKGIDKLCSRV